jgi:hypothetical protein
MSIDKVLLYDGRSVNKKTFCAHAAIIPTNIAEVPFFRKEGLEMPDLGFTHYSSPHLGPHIGVYSLKSSIATPHQSPFQ